MRPQCLPSRSQAVLSATSKAIVIFFSLEALVFAQPVTRIYFPEQIFLNQRFDRPVRARISEGNFLVLDAKQHRVVVSDMGEHFIRQVGRYGTGPHGLFDPTDFATDPDGNIYILEAGNKRITVVNRNGVRIGGFPVLELSLALEVNSKKELILNQPLKGSLLTVYALDGARKRGFGQLRTAPRGFTTHGGHDDNETYNRVSITIDLLDNIYVAWWYEPRVQAYAPDGKLKWDVVLRGKEADRFEQLARSNNGYYKYNGQTVVLSGIAYDGTSDRIYVLFPSRTLYVLDKQGNHLGEVVSPVYDVWPFNSVTATNDGKLLFTDTNQGVYSVTTPILQN